MDSALVAPPLSTVRLFDGDNHYYEAEDCFTRYQDSSLPDRHKVHWVATEEGRRRLMIGDRVFRFIVDPTFNPVARPGGLFTMFQKLQDGIVPDGVDGEAALDPLTEDSPFRNREVRLQVLDAQNVQAAILLPTLGICVEGYMTDDSAMTASALHAFNRWLDEDWGFDHQGRIIAAPMISLLDVEAAVVELEWAIERGARVVHLQTGPVNGRSPADPHFDPFWARVNDSGVGVAYHASNNRYNRYSRDWGEDPDPPAPFVTGFQHATTHDHRGIYETVAALIFHNLFGRFPNVRIASIEQGSAWVPLAFSAFDHAYHLGRRTSPKLTALPTELLREHFFVSPFPEEDVPALVDLLGPDRVMMGSDWPHPEGLVQPADYVDVIKGLDEATRHKVLAKNAAAFTGLTDRAA